MKKYRIALFILTAVMAIPIICYSWIEWRSHKYLYNDENRLPDDRVALVLGTAKYASKGKINAFYAARIRAAAMLYRHGKVDYFVVSGANPTLHYNEPAQMKADLIAAGVPADHIQPDYAGFRTLDSILRMQYIFGNQKYIIISQPFHNARAVYLARAHGQDVVAYNASGVPISGGLKTYIREIGARMKALIDLYITDKTAKYYGEKIPFPAPE